MGACIGHSTPAYDSLYPFAPKGSTMCQPVPCQTCAKITWSGCGDHVAEVRAMVPADQWCPGHQESGSTAPGQALGR